ncbi:MAG: dipeptide epimerase [candidate division KSB1 bacterium]|nr:dipeptide epimerase [candidate division KSB1 bacterium]MDZ7318293.1 dipeptide epimerase [candidate division KSB1 bacterium]
MKLRYETRRLELNHQFTVARSSKAFAENVFLTLHADGVAGYGEAAPSYFFHESAATITQFYDAWQSSFLEIDIADVQWLERLVQPVAGNYAAKAGLNIAMFDLLGKLADRPLHQLLGCESNAPLVTSFTIGIDRLEVIKAKVLAADPFPILKIKLGTPDDYLIIETIRSLTDKPLRIDANEGWTREEAVSKINWLAHQNVELVEQPVLADDLDGLKYVRERVSLPVFADESLRTSADLERLAGTVDGVNIKLMKCGGLSEALRMVHRAKALELQTMIGCFIESSVAITAAAHIAALFDYIDLDGSLLLKADPFRGVKIMEGKLVLPEAAGLGVEFIGFK